MSTIGVSIAVPEPFGGELRRQREAFGDPAARFVPSHITLAPPCEVSDDQLLAAVDQFSILAARHAPFSMRLRGTGTFRPVSPVVFVAVSAGIANVEQLASDVCRGFGAARPAFPFHPHVTVAHHLDNAALDRAFAELADFEATFEVEEFVLYLHDEDTGWVPSKEFCLG